MCQHVCHGHAKCTDEAKTEVGCRPEYEIPPSLADVCEIVPPSLTVLFPPSCETDTFIVISIEDGL
jgi:hypothetical protein